MSNRWIKTSLQPIVVVAFFLLTLSAFGWFMQRSKGEELLFDDEYKLLSLKVISYNKAIVEGYRGESGEWSESNQKLYFRTEDGFTVEAGDRLSAHCRVREFGGVGHLYLTRENTTLVDHLPSWSRSVNHWAQRRLERLDLSPDALALVKSMLLGRRDMMSRELTTSYNRGGAAHLLAISGLHLAIIFLIFNFLLKILHVFPYGHIARGVAVLALLWIYAMVVGMGSSITRAAIMISLLQISHMLHRGYYSISGLLIAMILMVAYDSSTLFDVGFWLSVISVFTIILCALPLIRYGERRSRKWGDVANILFNSIFAAFIIGLLCSVALAPLLSHIFGYFSLLGIVINPLITITTYLILLASLVWVLFGFGWLAPLFGSFIDSMCRVQNFAVRSVPDPIELRLDLWEVVVIYIAIIILIFCANRSKKSDASS